MTSKALIGAVFLPVFLSACSTQSTAEKTPSDNNQTASNTQRMKPGMWEAIGGIAAAAGADARRCVTAQEALAANGSEAEIRAAIEAELKKDGCTLASLSVDATTVTVEQVCSGIKVKTTNTYHGDTSTTVITGGGLPEMKTESRRVGDC